MTHNGRANMLYRLRRWRLRTFTAYGSGKPALYRLHDGREFVVHPGDQLSTAIAIEKRYEPLESRIVAKILRPGDVALDIGANIGYYTALCSACVGTQGTVLAFEPGEATFSKLKTTIALLGLCNVEPHALALADESGFQDFVMSSSGSDAQQSLVDWDLLVGEKKLARVGTVTLDEVVHDLNRHGKIPAFVKCDVEGAEGKVLKGARALLDSASPPVFMVEINREGLAAQRSNASEILRRFDGYRLYFTPLNSQEPKMRLLTSTNNVPDLINVVAFPSRGSYTRRIEAIEEYLLDGEGRVSARERSPRG